MRAEPTRRVITSIVSSEQLERFAVRTGVDLRELSELMVVVHPAGRLVLARGDFDAPLAVREAGERMAPLESSDDDPLVRRVGFLGERRLDLTALDEHAVAWIEGTPELAAQVLASARRAGDVRRHALEDDPLPELREAFGDAPFALYAPRPLDLPRDTGIGMLLAQERAMVVVARPAEGELLELTAELRGAFPPGAHENFLALATSIAESDLGAALGARDALPTLRIQSEETRVVLAAEVDARLLSAGLRTVLVAEMRELLEPVEEASEDH